MRYLITDEVRDVLGPLVERCRSPHGPEPELPERMFLEAVLYWARTGCPWRDLPGEFGDWSAAYNRLRCWVHSGRLGRRFAAMTGRPECDELRRVMIDSTIVRTHQHAAGTRRKKGAPRRKRSAARGAGSRRRSAPSPGGQRNDAPLAEPVLAAVAEAMGRIDEVLGDKAFDSDAIRGTILYDQDALPVISNRSNRAEPWYWDDEMAEMYKDRNRIERAFGKAKQFRRFATRYDKLKAMYVGVVQLVFGFIHVRKLARTVNST